MSTIINSPGVVTSVGNSQLFFGIPLPTSCSLRLRVPMEIPLPVEVRIVTTLDHPLPGDALWLFLDGEAAQGFAFLGYTAADYPGKIVLRFHGTGVLGLAQPTRVLLTNVAGNMNKRTILAGKIAGK